MKNHAKVKLKIGTQTLHYKSLNAVDVNGAMI